MDVPCPGSVSSSPRTRFRRICTTCLESVLGPVLSRISKSIAVDDCSPDACGAIVDEFAARDARVRAVHLPENVGARPGPQRRGSQRATGDYLLFLDGDDTLAPDALRAIADRIKEAGDPDVLVYDHAHALWSGETVRSPFLHQLTETGPVPFRLDDRPRAAQGAAGRLEQGVPPGVRRGRGLTFAPGAHRTPPGRTRY